MKQKSLLKLLIVVLVLNGKKRQRQELAVSIVAIKAGSAFVVLLSIISASAMIKASC